MNYNSVPGSLARELADPASRAGAIARLARLYDDALETANNQETNELRALRDRLWGAAKPNPAAAP